MLCVGSEVGTDPGVVAFLLAAGAADGSCSRMFTSGMTAATELLACSRVSSPLDTVAANELISVYCLMWVACTARSSVSSDDCDRLTVDALAAAALLPTCACAGWLFMMTMTC